ncbi:hypothetical protein CROQUDRAFT_715918 [Cronartium quercuum f. sp. fusiforme G11]|uniref:Protein phosphatase n=1 Tax=Cronartium quercuum f. sp. fusiforme G11 TaxID=708437 RepID=A0A9P6TB24_9BASI|nr:hypothetical protein CROQUDRAFT_715918 [Cronartium quercuum f. sp. fusiforme G11]
MPTQTLNPDLPPPHSIPSLSDSTKTPEWRFITAASFVGKPVDPEQTTTSKSVSKTLVNYRRWVEQEKRQWYDAVISRYPSNKPIPDFSTITHSGHDWWFVERNQGFEEAITFGVADGVGGWDSEHGADPAEVAQGLMYHASRATKYEKKPVEMIVEAYQAVLADPTITGGASTALVASLDPFEPAVSWANLGDSALTILRNGKVLLSTNAQTHYFNCPFQLTKLPRGIRIDRFGELDRPENASVGSQKLQDGDLVLAFTDGMADNIWSQEMCVVAEKLMSRRGKTDEELVDDLAHTLCGYARLISFQTEKLTPFEAEARRNGINDMRGGKVDDITLVVALCRKKL